MNEDENLYPCVGVCMADPDSGYCLGCGRPPLPSAGAVVAEEARGAKLPTATAGDPDSASPNVPRHE